jgi:competence protein ComEC
MIIFSIVMLCNSQKRKYGMISILFVSNLLIWKWVMDEKKMDIIFMDVGQGDAAVIILPNDKTMLIDAGQRNQYEDMGNEIVLPVLKYLNIEKLDWVVMSHPHSDHIGGLVSLINEVKIDTVWDSFIPYKSWTYNTIISKAESNEVHVIHPHQGQVMKLSDNVFVEFLAPDSIFAVSEHNVNNASIVFKLSYGATSVLFTGDLEHEGDQFLLPYEEMLKVNVLKVAHHGSITSTTASLLDFIQPNIAVVSVGRKNKFSHPSSIVMERLEERNILIHRTDENGALWLRSDGVTFTEVLWK